MIKIFAVAKLLLTTTVTQLPRLESVRGLDSQVMAFSSCSSSMSESIFSEVSLIQTTSAPLYLNWSTTSWSFLFADLALITVIRIVKCPVGGEAIEVVESSRVAERWSEQGKGVLLEEEEELDRMLSGDRRGEVT